LQVLPWASLVAAQASFGNRGDVRVLHIDSFCKTLQVFDDWKAARDDWLAAQQQHAPNIDELGSPAGVLETAPSGGATSTSKRHSSRGLAVVASGAAEAPPAPPTRYPKLSTVSLAFLEACCRAEAGCGWRVYDVCAVMRQQKELKRQAGLARPQKQSHHVAPA
jgi:hypothetical protein